jgi:hypothetical protein
MDWLDETCREQRRRATVLTSSVRFDLAIIDAKRGHYAVAAFAFECFLYALVAVVFCPLTEADPVRVRYHCHLVTLLRLGPHPLDLR